MDISLVVVTKGDVDLDRVLDGVPFDDVVIWDNSERYDRKVYGRYVGLYEGKHDLIAVQDDDVIVPWAKLLAEYREGERLCNMDARHPVKYDHSSLVGWGAIFPKEDPDRAFERYGAELEDEVFLRTCDIVFTGLLPFRRVDVGRTDMPWAVGTERMHMQPYHYAERERVTKSLRNIPSVSVVIPTVGRDTLQAAVDSAQDADEIIVVGDGVTPEVLSHHKTRILTVEGGGRENADIGYTARTAGIQAATSAHIAFQDDDDAYLPGAIDTIRAHLTDVPVVFQMRHPLLGLLPRTRAVTFGNVSSQMFVVPNDPVRMGEWAPHNPGLKEPGGDYTFLKGCVDRMGGVHWVDEEITVLRPDERRTVSVITPWTDHLELADDYFKALEAGPNPTEVIVVDNASDPPLDFAAVRSDTNLGFSGGSNLGLAEATGDVVMFLNNDVYAQELGWLHRIASRVEPGVLVGVKLRHDRHGDVDGEPFPYLDGWCLAGMRDDLLELGGFDETFEEPAYYSDNDLCFRARLAGFSLREEPAGIRHKGGATTQANGYVLPSTTHNKQLFESRVREALQPA